MRDREFESLGKKLIPLLPGFAAKRYLVFESPIKHILRGLCFENDGYSKSTFRVLVFYQALCVPKSHISLNFGERLEPPFASSWDNNSRTLQSDLVHAIHDFALPFLSGSETPLGLARKARASNDVHNHHDSQAIALSLALAGCIDEAVAEIDNLVPQIEGHYQWEIEIRDRVTAFRELLIADPDAAQMQLVEWEAETIRNLKLEKFWARSQDT